ncbi:MAG: hypothetical protein Q9209_005846 [Squamulea sp. 1 TL-2023]
MSVPLSLQIVIQPRVVPSSSNLGPSEPVVKWIEVCKGNPTIQDLSEALEKRFFRRNHRPLDIKVLKNVDDFELFPDTKLREIFEDYKEVKQGCKDLCTVKVYRNPPTTVELADPRRFESLPPDSFARPIKRSASPHFPPPPPLFDDVVRNGIRNTIDRPNSQVSHIGDGLQASNKRRKVQTYGSTAYDNDPDHAIDSREFVDDSHIFSQIAHKHPSQVPQVEDSQTSPRKKRSDPYGTPISSQISQHTRGRSREVGVFSVPDSPQYRAINYDHGSLRPDTAFRNSRSSSPEVPSSLGHPAQVQEAPTRARLLNILPQPRQSLKTIVKTQAQPSVLPRDRESLSQSEEIQDDQKSSVLLRKRNQGLKLPDAIREASHMASPSVPSEVYTSVETISAPQAPQTSAQNGKDGRLKRPKIFSYVRALQRTPKLINGIRQTVPSIAGIFDPIETSEGSSYERDLSRDSKRSRVTAPQKNQKELASHKAESNKNSLIVRLRVPPIAQPESSSITSREVVRGEMPVDTHTVALGVSTREPSYQRAYGEAQNGTVESLTDAGDLAKQSTRPDDAVVAGNEEAQSSSKLDVTGTSPARAGQSECMISSVQGGTTPANAPFVDTVDDSPPTSGEDIGDELLERQLKEAQEVREKAQVEFDRITALQRKRQGLHKPKADLTISVSSVKPSVDKELTPSTLALSQEAQRIYSSDDLEAKRKYGLEQLASTRNKYFKDTVAVDTTLPEANKERQVSTEPKIKQAQAEARKEARRAKEQRNKEARISIARKLDEQIQQEEEERETERVEARKVQSGLTAKQTTKNAKPAQQEGIGQNSDALAKVISQKRSSQEPSKQARGPQPKDDDKGLDIEAEAAKSERNKAKATMSTEQAIRNSSSSKLAERSPKARLNAQRQLQIADRYLKYSKNDSGTANTPMSISNVAGPQVRAPKSQKRAGVKKAANKTRSDAQVHSGQRKDDAELFTNHVDYAALQAARAAGLSVKTRPAAFKQLHTAAGTPSAPKAAAVDLTADTLRSAPKNSSSRSSSPSLTRHGPDQARTMTPVMPSFSSLKKNPDSAEARARRAASISARNSNTPTRTALQPTSGSRRSVSFAGESIISQLHDGKRVNHDSTPTPSSQSSESRIVGKTPTKTKQTTMTQHIDRKLKGKVIDPPLPRRAPVEEKIIISSESEASTFYSNMSEEERNARAGPSSRKKPKSHDFSSRPVSAFGNNSRNNQTIIIGSKTYPAERRTSSTSSQKASTPAETSNRRVAPVDGAEPSHAKNQYDSESSSHYSQSTSVASTDNVSNLPQTRRTIHEQSDARTRSNHDHVPQTPTRRGGDVVSKVRVQDEERLQLEVNEQLQREYSQALQAKPTKHELPNKAESTKQVIQQPDQNTQSAVRPEHEKYGSRIRINPSYDNSSLRQLRKAQAAAQMSIDQTAKASDLQKSIDRPPVESSSASDSENSSSSGSTEALKPFQKAHDQVMSSTPQKKGILPGVWRDLYGREGSGKNSKT